MKLWQALAALLFVTATLHAQVPFYGGYPLWQQQYYPGARLPPGFYSHTYYPQVYYPQAYYPQAYYPQQYGDPFFVNNNDEEVDSLSREVRELNNEILQLRSELASAQAQAQQAQAQLEQVQALAAVEEDATPRPPIVLVFNNGQHVEAQGYAIVGEILWIMTESGSQRVALSSLNTAATQKVNLQRGISFPDLRNR